MSAIYPSQHIYISINRALNEVYSFLSDSNNLSKWASGVAGSVDFAPKNEFGVLDHVVTLASGEKLKVPMRVIQNGQGSEVIFTLYHLPGVAQSAYMKDVLMVSKDLQKLKQILELPEGVQ